jgi:hypothetical protein
MPNLTYTIDELLGTRFTNKYITGFDFSGLVAVMNDELAIWNGQMNEMLAKFCDTSNKQMMNTGSSDVGEGFVPLDEVGKAPASGALPGNTLGWPLRRFGRGIQVNRFWAEMATPYDLLMKQNEVQIMAKQRVIREIRKGLFHNANYAFTDRFYDQISIPVKAFYNADAAWKIPSGPTGTVFTPATHDHFTAEIALTSAGVDAMVNNVAEHGGKSIEIHISLTNKAAFTALAGYVALQPNDYEQFASTINVLKDKLNNDDDPNDQYIGKWDSGSSPIAKVYVKPWSLAGYIVCVATNADQKPLMYRIHPNVNLAGLRLWSKTDDGSLFNDQYEMLMGISALNRGGVSVHQIGVPAYVSPFTAATLEI